jgi:biotin synthase
LQGIIPLDVNTLQQLEHPLRVDWSELAQRVLSGEPIDRRTALAVLQSPDSELLSLLAAAYEVRKAAFGNQVQLYYLMNAKSGLCPEDCNYCSQSRISTAEIPKYPLLSREELVAGAHRAVEHRACTFCIVASGRGPTKRELEHVVDAVREIRETTPLRICACLGILADGQAEQLREAGVERFNHNLNTSEEYHESICTTHTFQDRVRTVEEIKSGGISACSGGIVGMGERDEDVVSLAFALRDLEVESIPVNFYHPVEGTPLAGTWNLNPRYCLKVLAMFRFVNPTREIRIAGGRELHLRSMQPLGLYAANSIFVSDYLTTQGQSAADDFRMLEDLGFEIASPNGQPIPAG